MLLVPVTFADTGQWVKYLGNPVLAPTPTAWDADYTTTPRVYVSGGLFRMWYNGGGPGGNGIGYATSADGVSWAKRSGPVLAPGTQGAWDSSSVLLGSVLWNGTLFMMWYRGANPTGYAIGAVGLATSKDGISWTKYAGNPVMTATSVDQGYIASPYVVKLVATYDMWYTGRNTPYTQSNWILFATSFDGVHWSKWPSPVLQPSTNPSDWDSGAVYSPSIYYNGTTFWLWYSGLRQNSTAAQIGIATSPDGSTWTRYPSNPILSPGTPGAWDSSGVDQPNLIMANGLMLYYDGLSPNAGARIGLALAPQGFAIPEFPVPALVLLLAVTGFAATRFQNRNRSRAKSHSA